MMQKGVGTSRLTVPSNVKNRGRHHNDGLKAKLAGLSPVEYRLKPANHLQNLFLFSSSAYEAVWRTNLIPNQLKIRSRMESANLVRFQTMASYRSEKLKCFVPHSDH